MTKRRCTHNRCVTYTENNIRYSACRDCDYIAVLGKTCPECGAGVWDVSTVDQALNKCWSCGIRWLDDIGEDNDGETEVN